VGLHTGSTLIIPVVLATKGELGTHARHNVLVAAAGRPMFDTAIAGPTDFALLRTTKAGLIAGAFPVPAHRAFATSQHVDMTDADTIPT